MKVRSRFDPLPNVSVMSGSRVCMAKASRLRQRGFVAIGETSPGSISGERAAQISLTVALVAGAAMMGGGLYEAYILFPLWSAAPPRSFGLLQYLGGPSSGPLAASAALGQCWMAVHAAVALSALIALGFNWSGRGRRALILAALALFAGMRLWTYISLRPELDLILSTPIGDTATAALRDRIAVWGAHSQWRELGDCLFVGSLALAFRFSVRRSSRRPVRAASAFRQPQERGDRGASK